MFTTIIVLFCSIFLFLNGAIAGYVWRERQFFKHKEDTMPLIKSKSKKAIGENIKKEEALGKGKKQSIAIALSNARKYGAKIPKKKS